MRRRLSFHHERTPPLPLDLLLAQPDLAVPLFHIISFVIDERHGGLNGGLVLPVRPAARRAILEGVLAGPAARPLGHGLVKATPRRRSAARPQLPQPAWLAVCGQLLLSAVASLSMRHGQPWLPLLVEGSNTLPKLRFDGRRLRAARSAHKGLGCIFRAVLVSSYGMRLRGDMSGVGDTKRLREKLRVVEKATSGAKASQISQSLIGNCRAGSQ